MAKYINGIKVQSSTIDLTDRKFNRLTVLYLVGRNKSRRGLVWKCKCVCGCHVNVVGHDLRIGDTVSCGCRQKECIQEHSQSFSDKYRTHGKSGTREYNAWKRIKARCQNEKNKDFAVYSKIGMSPSFSSDYSAFLEDIGEIPADLMGRISVDRIDNTKGYVEGNVRWATDDQQARNKGKYANNKSGVTGVHRYSNNDGIEYWTATWREEGLAKSKSFSIKRYGDELAFFAACEMRELMIERLNMQGAGYTENHGK